MTPNQVAGANPLLRNRHHYAMKFAGDWVRYGAMDERGAFDELRAQDVDVSTANEIVGEARAFFEFGMAVRTATLDAVQR